MKSHILLLFLYFFASSVGACVYDPAYRIAKEAGKHLERYDSVFLGRFDSSTILESKDQVAEFLILKTFKGEKGNRVIVLNKVGSSCSRYFSQIGTAYYVFANKQEQGADLVIDYYASFVPMSVALETDMDLK